jgi:hypothetical protein
VDDGCTAAEPNAGYAAALASDHVADHVAQPTADDPSDEAAFRAERAAQCALLRCLFGNPFRPVAFGPAWRTPTTTAIARSIYEERRFGELPVLTDALEAGCTDAEVLGHCRSGGEHAKGCWVVDLILSKDR